MINQANMQIDSNSISSSNRSRWTMCGKIVARSQIVFLVQIILIYIVCITSLIQLTRDKDKELWIALLASCLGYLLPSPKLNKKADS